MPGTPLKAPGSAQPAAWPSLRRAVRCRAVGLGHHPAQWLRPGQQQQHPEYPAYNPDFPGLECLHAEPPVFLARDFLSRAECAALVGAAREGRLSPLPYEKKVVVNTSRLWPLGGVIAAGAGLQAWHAAQHDPSGIAAAAAAGLLQWSALVAAAVAGVQQVAQRVAGTHIFTGTKWTTAGLESGNAVHRATLCFVSRAAELLCCGETSRLEAPTVTRYCQGQYQKTHFDARPSGDPQREQVGGQRLAQVICYLNTLDEEGRTERGSGGGTRFHHACMGGLTVTPRQGAALLFFPCFAGGEMDGRMAHSGAPVLAGEKWSINTWLCEAPVPGGAASLLS